MSVKVETYQTDPSMIDYNIEGDSAAEVYAAMDDVLRCYPTAGYGTAFYTMKAENGRYTVSGYRSKSCE